ncbi:MAG: hypothetical protein WA747_13600 [Steroidobacteraceae bacterium]
MTESPTVHYWHLWTDAEGVSHQTHCTMTEFELRSIQPSAAPQWLGKNVRGPMSVLTTVLPPAWKGDWHENPKPQWIIPLSGRWFVESMDGTRIEMGCGDISFGADQHCRPIAGRRGHRSGTVGEAPVVLMLVQFDDASAPRGACGFR